MESEQGKKTEETHLQQKIYNILKDSVNNKYSQLSVGQSLITLLEKQLLAHCEQFVEIFRKAFCHLDKEGDEKCVVDNIVLNLETNDIPSNLFLKIGSYEGLDSIALRGYVLYQKSVDEKDGRVWTNKFILTQYGGETKDGERKNDNTRNDGEKAKSNQNADGGGAQGLSGFMSTSTSGSSSGGDGGDGKGGNDDWNKTPRDLQLEVDPEEEEAEKSEEETREIEKKIENKKETRNAERAGQNEDDDVCRQEKNRHSIETHREQEQETAVHRPFRNLRSQQFSGNFDLQSRLSKIQLILPTFGQNLCRPLHQFPWFYLTESNQLTQSDLLPFIGNKQKNVKIVSASARLLTAYTSDVLRSGKILWMGRNQMPTIGLHRQANVKLQTSNYAGSQMQNEQPQVLLTENALRRRNICQRFQVVIFTICVFDGHCDNQSCSSVIITDPGLSPDPLNIIRHWPQNLQKILKGVLYWVSLSFQRFMTSQALVQRHGLLQHPVTCISQTTNCIQTILRPSRCLVTLDEMVFTVSVTLLPTGCLLPCPWSSITAILTVTQQIEGQQKILFIQTNAGSGISEMSQSILSFGTPILGNTFRNMQRSALHGASRMVNVIHPRTAVFVRTEQLTEPTLPVADNFPCQLPQQHQKMMQRETAHQPRQTQPMAATDDAPCLQQPQVWAAPFKETSKVDSQSQIMINYSAEKSLPSIRRAPTSRREGALRQTRRSYIPVDHSCLEQHVMFKQAQLLLLQQHQANRLQNELLRLTHLNTVSMFMPFECEASDDARHPSAVGQVVNPNDIGVHHPSLNSTDYHVSRMDSGVSQRANQHPKGQQRRYSGQPYSSAKFPSCSSKQAQTSKNKTSGKTLSPGPSMAPVQHPHRSSPKHRGGRRSPSKEKADPRPPFPTLAGTGRTKTTMQHRATTSHPYFRSTSRSNVSPSRGYPGPPNLSSQDQSGNRERGGVQDYRAAQQSILSNAERVGGPPNRASGFGFSSTIMGLQPNSPNAESRSNPNPGTVRGLRGFPFEPGDKNQCENRAQDFSQAQHRPQRGGRKPYPVFPQCSEDQAALANSSSDHDVNQRRQGTTGGLRSTPQKQHSTNQGELPFPTPCQEDVHRDPANPSAASNHGEVSHDTANGGPAQQAPAPNNYQRCQINLRGCTVLAKPDHMTAAELDIRLHDMCQICGHQLFTRVFSPCGHRACEYCSSILRFCCICTRWIQDKFRASFG